MNDKETKRGLQVYRTTSTTYMSLCDNTQYLSFILTWFSSVQSSMIFFCPMVCPSYIYIITYHETHCHMFLYIAFMKYICAPCCCCDLFMSFWWIYLAIYFHLIFNRIGTCKCMNILLYTWDPLPHVLIYCIYEVYMCSMQLVWFIYVIFMNVFSFAVAYNFS